MRYVISDIHGEYGMCMSLLDEIGFSRQDTLYVCGDMVDKGNESVHLLKFMLNSPNVRCILGNHEYSFLKAYWAIMKTSPANFDGVLNRLRRWFPWRWSTWTPACSPT